MYISMYMYMYISMYMYMYMYGLWLKEGTPWGHWRVLWHLNILWINNIMCMYIYTHMYAVRICIYISFTMLYIYTSIAPCLWFIFPHFASGTSPEQLQGAKMRLEYQARAVEHVWYLKMVSVPQVWTVSIGTWLFSTFFNQPFLGYSMLKQHTTSEAAVFCSAPHAAFWNTIWNVRTGQSISSPQTGGWHLMKSSVFFRGSFSLCLCCGNTGPKMKSWLHWTV